MVLVVDDEASLRTVTCRMLERQGFRSLDVSSCDEAIRVVGPRASGVAAVVLDMTMVSSEELFRHLRLTCPDLPVVLTSGYPLAMLRRRFGLRACDRFLQKPFTAEALGDALRALVG